jgi:hypothetical protein
VIGRNSNHSVASLIRAAQTGVFDLDIRIFNRLFIDVCKPFDAEIGLKSRNLEKNINACLSGPIGRCSSTPWRCTAPTFPWFMSFFFLTAFCGAQSVPEDPRSRLGVI